MLIMWGSCRCVLVLSPVMSATLIWQAMLVFKHLGFQFCSWGALFCSCLRALSCTLLVDPECVGWSADLTHFHRTQHDKIGQNLYSNRARAYVCSIQAVSAVIFGLCIDRAMPPVASYHSVNPPTPRNRMVCIPFVQHESHFPL